MTACTEAGCDGQIAADGYCDTCGVKPGAGAAGSVPVAGPVDAGAADSRAASRIATPVAGSACSQPGCEGQIATDGYCDTCGIAATSASVSSPAAFGGSSSPVDASVVTSTIAAPEPPDLSSRIPGSGSPTAMSRRTMGSRRSTAARTGIGAGLITVASTPAGDPAQAVMSEEKVRAVLGEVPEEDRFCSSCGRPVGRGSEDQPGRVKGFCGTCRTPFDFVTNEPSLAIGEQVGGQYEILGPLAHGGMGWVYLGRDKAVSDRWVVLKGLLNEDDPDAALAAVAERQFLAQIEHANIVNIYNFVTHRGAGYIVMEFVGGQSLNGKLKERRKANAGIHNPLPLAEAIAYVLGILPAFGYLHSLGLVYNDLKPANIMSVGDEVKLIDVGAVMRADDDSAAIFGTQGFQAPEVAKHGPSVASDLYTVRRTLAVLVIRFVFHTGPFQYGLPTPAAEPLFVRWESLYRLLLKATAAHPDDRFQTADVFAEQLTGVLREVVAISQSRSIPSTSEHFGADQLTNLAVASANEYVATRPDWQVLPKPKVDPEDPAAAFLADLPDAAPGGVLELLSAAVGKGEVESSREIALRQAREELVGGADPSKTLDAIGRADPWDWRVTWYRSLYGLKSGQAVQAAEGFSEVWTELPGEPAPKLAVALAAEAAGQFQRAGQLYEQVISVDNTFVSAAFGMARCLRALDDIPGAVAAFGRVPVSSAAHYDAQVASARALVEGGSSGVPTGAELSEAAATIERLQLDAGRRAELSADVFERALAGVRSGQIPAGSHTLMGHDLSELSLRRALEGSYRAQARFAESAAERVRLVDKANRIRPRTLV